MAAAEARAAWQRTANRCFVQEDAKRAPKLACVPPSSSSSSSCKQVDTRPASNGLDEFIPPSANSIYSNLSPDSRWWLQLQPNYMYQKGLTNEQVNTGNSHQFVDIMDCQSSVKGYNVGEESYEFVEMDCVDCSKGVDEFSLESEFPHWMESEKSHELPWWRMTDKDDLASFVAQRSHDFMENCDLPQPQNRNFKTNQKQHEFVTSFDISKSQKHQCQNEATMNADSGPVSQTLSGDGTVEGGDMDESKRKLLEALCHSQTRAREAEKAAKQAREEKEHVVKLIFKQASQLFAYKQWLYLLQLENLYNQFKTNSNKITPIFPPSPWQMPRKKARPPSAKRKRRGIPGCKHDLGNYAVAFAVGLGLVGAGLLLGWTVGWMFI
ncbi:hypothetical protein LXL04_026636 [Taraxacum kok-saghyz]